MNKRNRKGSAIRRALLRIRRSRVADILSIGIIVVGTALIIFFPVLDREEPKETALTEEPSGTAEPITIKAQEPCETGIVMAMSGEELVYEYFGKVEIKNDGKNGKEIEVLIECPDGTWPCSCMEE